jgi:putative PIN family toxin of toxin-antitoxin system
VYRIVVDSNTTVSAFLWGGTPRQFFAEAIENGVVFLSSNVLIEELENTLNKPKLKKYVALSGKTPSELVAEFARLVVLVEPVSLPLESVRDRDDVKVLEAAVAGRATHIITGDLDLLVLTSFANIPIVEASEFLEVLRSTDSG